MDGQAELLIKDLVRNIARVERDRVHNRRAAVGLRVVATVLSALVTIMLGTKGFVPARFSDAVAAVALVASTALTGLTGWEGFADHAGRWIRKRTTFGALMNLQDDIMFALAGDQRLTATQLKEFRDRYNYCIGEEHRLWLNERAKLIASPLGGGSGR